MAGQAVHEIDGFQRAETLTDRAYRELEEAIVTLRIPSGTMLSEAQLSRRLGVGRTLVREALQRLAREWLVVIMPRRGIFVSEIDVARQFRLLDARRVLERLLAQSAAHRCSRGQRAQFAAIATGMDRAAKRSDDLSFIRLDRECNLLLLAAAGNEFAAASMGLMTGLSRRFCHLHYKQVADLPLAARLHAATPRAVSMNGNGRARAASTAAATRSAAWSNPSIGSAASPLASSMEPPANPAAAARRIVSATSPGASPKPFSRSGDTGRSVSATIAAALASVSSRPTVPSRCPSAKARPALVVANASKPSAVRMRAVPASHGLGITKAPGRACKAWNTAAFAAWFGMAVLLPGPMELAVMSSSPAPSITVGDYLDAPIWRYCRKRTRRHENSRRNDNQRTRASPGWQDYGQSRATAAPREAARGYADASRASSTLAK